MTRAESEILAKIRALEADTKKLSASVMRAVSNGSAAKPLRKVGSELQAVSKRLATLEGKILTALGEGVAAVSDIEEARGGFAEILDSYLSTLAHAAREKLMRVLGREGASSVKVEKVGQYSRRLNVTGRKFAGSVTLTILPKSEEVAIESVFGTRDGASVSHHAKFPFAMGETGALAKIAWSAQKASQGALKFAGESVEKSGDLQEMRQTEVQKVSPQMKAAKDIRLKSGKVIPKGTPVEEIKHIGPTFMKSDVRFRGFKPLYLPTALLANYVTGFKKPPKSAALEKMVFDGIAKSITGKRVEPDGIASDGSPSWLLVLGYI